MNNKICCVILVLIIIVLLYRITVMEHFDNHDNNINSIVSKIDGMSLNIEKHDNFDTNKILHILVDNNGSQLGYEDNSNGLLTFKDKKHEWKLELNLKWK